MIARARMKATKIGRGEVDERTCDERRAFRVVRVVVWVERRVKFAFVAVAVREVVAHVHLRVERLQRPRTFLSGHCEGRI